MTVIYFLKRDIVIKVKVGTTFNQPLYIYLSFSQTFVILSVRMLHTVVSVSALQAFLTLTLKASTALVFKETVKNPMRFEKRDMKLHFISIGEVLGRVVKFFTFTN